MKLPTAPLENPVLSELCGRKVIQWDVVHVKKDQKLLLRFVSINSKWRQGVWLGAKPGIVIYGAMHKSLLLWHDNSPPVVEMTVRAEDGNLHLYNIWDSYRGLGHESQSYTSGMLIEQAGNTHTYRCHDIGKTPDFSKLVFSLEISND